MGMPKIELRLQMFRGDWDQIWSQMRLLWGMEGLCRINQTHIRQFDAFKKRGLIERSYPSVYRSGLHYETEKGTEIWPDIPSLLTGVMGRGIYSGPWGDCLPLSTLVLKDDYTVVPIGSLVPGDKIMGDGNWTMVTEQVITGDKTILEFELDNGSIFRCSREHRLFQRDGGEVRAKDVKVGMKLLTPRTEFPSTEETRLKDDRISGKDFAWLVGAYVADGWSENPRHHRFSISGKDPRRDGKPRLKRDKTAQKMMSKKIAEDAGLDTYWHERYLRISDTSLSAFMASCGRHAPEKHLSTLQISREQVAAVVAGLRADAAYATSGTATHGTTSPQLAIQIRLLYRMMGQSVHIKRWDDHGGLGKNPIYRITVRRSDAEVGRHQDSKRNSASVLAVREGGEELCCDITTESHRFYLPESDLIVHNCEDLACYRVAELRELPFHYARQAPWNKQMVEVADPRYPVDGRNEWKGWKKYDKGIAAKPFAKWRRGPRGNYHYHALVLLPDGRLEDPSLVLGMGTEKEFDAGRTAEKLKAGAPVVIQYAKPPDVMVVDPEAPSGYAGGKAKQMDARVVEMLRKGIAPEDVYASLGDLELGAYASNEIPLGVGEFDVDALIGWSRAEKRFVAKGDKGEARRLFGYSDH